MTDFSIFKSEEAELLASLPYKVGAWVGHSEDQGGEEDDKREEAVLSACLKRFVKLKEDKPFVGSVVSESLRRADRWAVWADESHSVLADIKRAVVLLRDKRATPEEIKGLKATLMEIGTAVAQASGEFSGDDADGKGFLGKMIGKIAGFMADDAGHPMNVSAAEDSALEELRQTLRGKR
ncbi:MAG: hypothetical protein WBK77_09690 [Alphaproteobacteria bacterium]